MYFIKHEHLISNCIRKIKSSPHIAIYYKHHCIIYITEDNLANHAAMQWFPGGHIV